MTCELHGTRISMSIKKVLLGYSHACLFTFCLQLLSHYKGRVDDGSPDCVAWKASNIYHFCRESLSSPSLSDKVFLQQYIIMLCSVRIIRGEACCNTAHVMNSIFSAGDLVKT